MASILPQRLRDGRPQWRDQLAFRLAGLACLAGFGAFMRMLCALQHSDPALAAHPAMFAACFAAAILFHAGLGLALIGPDLVSRRGPGAPSHPDG